MVSTSSMSYLGLAKKAIEDTNNPWDEAKRNHFKKHVFVVNDVSACAAFEYTRRQINDFVFLKLHVGANFGVVQPPRHKDQPPSVKTNHPEAGHSYPMLHPLDHATKFFGVCPVHGWCFEGMLAAHGIYQRAKQFNKAKAGSKTGRFSPRGKSNWTSWKRIIRTVSRERVRRTIDNALLKYALDEADPNPAGKGMGIELIAHYAAQLVHQVAIGPLTPELIVLGGQMATRPVVRAVGKNVFAFAKGYPRRNWLLNETAIEHYIVASVAEEEENSPEGEKNSGETAKPQFTIELQGAVTIALSKATEPADQGSVLLFGPRRKG